ncbi:MerR family transcriptional regulator [Pandoraea sputorum]|uniref:Copper export regulator n=1 Tax=Pandoraea sputorum TaxID=93222 RepID=A0A239SJV4_9BURK|nr:MerR family transcriptional regulator [Pandoraea sputorum]AJC17085.1 MerR family transcriptional regulator [Pandoraea sputorum]SNU85148.1 Copper export regulator [Pandoraea sputorum]VVD83268.1 MerR family transcriptional regulator [Pandoraea sputorum]
MKDSVVSLNASEAARRLGVSNKALRLYEQHGLLSPKRSSAGYRTYDSAEMARASEVVALRALGLSLAQVASVLKGNAQTLSTALEAHEHSLDAEIRERLRRLETVRSLRAELASGRMPNRGELPGLVEEAAPSVAFELPWPWGGEWFEMRDIRALNYIIGSLGSGKTRLAMRLAQALPNGAFLGLDRLDPPRVVASGKASIDNALQRRVDQALIWLVDDGAEPSDALTILVTALEADRAGALVVDMIEQDLAQPTQEALIRYLRMRARTRAHPLFMMTRSSSILDLSAVGSDEAVVLCPANHSPPVRVAPYAGSPGFEAVTTCLASPEVRARIAAPPAPV